MKRDTAVDLDERQVQDNSIKIGVDLAYGMTATSETGVLIYALLDEQGNVVACGNFLAAAILTAAIEAHENLWLGNGHLQVIKPLQ